MPRSDHLDDATLAGLALGEMPLVSEAEHLDRCSDCQASLEGLRRTIATLEAGPVPVTTPPPVVDVPQPESLVTATGLGSYRSMLRAVLDQVPPTTGDLFELARNLAEGWFANLAPPNGPTEDGQVWPEAELSAALIDEQVPGLEPSTLFELLVPFDQLRAYARSLRDRCLEGVDWERIRDRSVSLHPADEQLIIATSAQPPSGLATRVAGHLDGPLVCLACRARDARLRRVVRYAAGDELDEMLYRDVTVEDSVSISLHCTNDDGYLRVTFVEEPSREIPQRKRRLRFVYEDGFAVERTCTLPRRRGEHIAIDDLEGRLVRDIRYIVVDFLPLVGPEGEP